MPGLKRWIQCCRGINSPLVSVINAPLAINAPFGLLWVADKTNPAVHAFDISVLAALHAEWLAPMMGIA